MFYVGQKVVCVDAENYEEYLRVGAVYTIRWLGTLEGMFLGMNLFYTANNKRSRLDRTEARVRPCEICVENDIIGGPWSGRKFPDWPIPLANFRPVTDISTLQAIVAEVKTGKPRKVNADRFDKVRA